MDKQEKAGFRADIPTDALDEALKSVEKYSDKDGLEKSEKKEIPTQEEQEQPLVRVEVEDSEEVQEGGLEPEEIASLRRELEKAREEAASMKDRMYRVAADADNIRKRALKEREEGLRFGQEGLLRDLLPVVDNLERTLAHVPDETDDPAFSSLRQGVEMVLKQFVSILESQGVKSFDAQGEKFDPKLHEALSRKETADAEPGTILSEMHKGFMLHERLLRPALVVVACSPRDEKEGKGQDEACGEGEDIDKAPDEEMPRNDDEETESSYDEDEG